MKKLKFIKRQDSGFKLSSGNSGETSLNLSNEIFDFISQGTLSQGEERDVVFRIYKEDCIKAMSFIIMKLPLYRSSSNYSNRVDNYLSTFNELYSKIDSFFGNNDSAEYSVKLFYRTDGRIYLKGLRVNDFSVRDYLVENYSAIQFDDEGRGLLNLRILSDIEDNGEISEENFSREDLLRQLSAATFLRKALKIVIEEDANLSKLEALNKYKETNKQLKINGFNLWRKKDDLPLRLEDVWQDIEIEYKGQQYVMYLEWTPADMERMFFPVFNSAYNGQFNMCKEGNEYVLYKLSKSDKPATGAPRQQIFYGAPGTGKSHKIKDDEYVIAADAKNLVFRITFHPDSDYSTFVGAYKPIMRPVPTQFKAVAGKDEDIAYEFIPQAFLQAYIAAWNNPEEKVFLVIEEINRGNCAQIFGDLFQLLDRDEKGESEYPIKADRDLAKFLNGKDDQGIDVLINKDGIKDGKLKLPKNLYIWATMNTSDQSLFPIDSAFKRRWDWVYMPIGYKNTNWTIEIGDKKYEWVKFQRIINDKIYGVDNSEDKQLGDYFVNADRTGCKISADTLLNKILFYIWNDVCKDDPDQIFQWVNDKKQNESIKFSDFFGVDKDKKLQGFMAYHKVPAIGETDNTDNADNTNIQEETPAENDKEINS